MSSHALPSRCTPHPQARARRSSWRRLRLTSSVPAWAHISYEIICLWSEGSRRLSKLERQIQEVVSPLSPLHFFFQTAIIHFAKKLNGTTSRSNLFTWNWLIVHSLSVVACIQLVSAESRKHFSCLAACTMRPAASLFHSTQSPSLKLILAAASVKVEGESKTLWWMYKGNIHPCKWRVITGSYTLLASSFIWVCFGRQAKKKERG